MGVRLRHFTEFYRLLEQFCCSTELYWFSSTESIWSCFEFSSGFPAVLFYRCFTRLPILLSFSFWILFCVVVSVELFFKRYSGRSYYRFFGFFSVFFTAVGRLVTVGEDGIKNFDAGFWVAGFMIAISGLMLFFIPLVQRCAARRQRRGARVPTCPHDADDADAKEMTVIASAWFQIKKKKKKKTEKKNSTVPSFFFLVYVFFLPNCFFSFFFGFDHVPPGSPIGTGFFLPSFRLVVICFLLGRLPGFYGRITSFFISSATVAHFCVFFFLVSFSAPPPFSVRVRICSSCSFPGNRRLHPSSFSSDGENRKPIKRHTRCETSRSRKIKKSVIESSEREREKESEWVSSDWRTF